MSSMIRKLMRGVQRMTGTRAGMSGAISTGTVRAGMHQKAEHEYKRSRMADGVPEPETMENALDMPESLEDEIPPDETEDEETADVAEGEAVIVPDAEILDEVAEEQTEAQNVEEIAEAKMAVDYSQERIPDIEPVVVTGSVSPETPLVYSPGDCRAWKRSAFRRLSTTRRR